MDPEEREEWQRKLQEFERVALMVAKYTGRLIAQAREQLNILEFRDRYRREEEEDEN